jgi:hypothetical protein
MHRNTRLALGATWVVTFLVAGALFADDSHKQPGPPSKAQPVLDKLKKLAGEWVYANGEQKGQPAVRYTVASAGSVVVESLFPGTDHEMVTVYHLDGDKLMMTHYCAAGNQPQMHAEPAADKLVFTCTGGSNMKETDGHMHAMTLSFVDDDHIKEEWTWKGEGAHTAAFEFERKKA